MPRITISRQGASHAATAGESGSAFVATAGDVTITLPAAVDGVWYVFVQIDGVADHPLRVAPQAGEKFLFPGSGPFANGQAVANNTGGLAAQGGSISAFGIAGAGWVLSGDNGSGWVPE